MSRTPLALAALAALAAAQGPLPRLNVAPGLTISGISSGADMAAAFAVAFSDVTSGVAVFAGQPFRCAVTRFAGEPLLPCAGGNPSMPGCTPGTAPCAGCPPGASVAYDHCKAPAGAPARVNVSALVAAARAAAAAGAVPPTRGLAPLRAFLFRGTRDETYLDGAVNATAAFFAAFAADAAAQIKFVADVPAGHCTPTVDPAVPAASCGTGAGAPPAMENCGYDGAGAAFAWLYAAGSVAPPPAGGCGAACAAAIAPFDQRLYAPASAWLGATGYALVPPACARGSKCRLHVALHGCGMAATNARMNMSYVRHSGFAAWGLANDIIVLFPQGGDAPLAPTAQLRSECFDGYGATGDDYAYAGGAQMAAVRSAVRAVAGW
jgi:hypothetical protein